MDLALIRKETNQIVFESEGYYLVHEDLRLEDYETEITYSTTGSHFIATRFLTEIYYFGFRLEQRGTGWFLTAEEYRDGVSRILVEKRITQTLTSPYVMKVTVEGSKHVVTLNGTVQLTMEYQNITNAYLALIEKVGSTVTNMTIDQLFPVGYTTTLTNNEYIKTDNLENEENYIELNGTQSTLAFDVSPDVGTSFTVSFDYDGVGTATLDGVTDTLNASGFSRYVCSRHTITGASRTLVVKANGLLRIKNIQVEKGSTYLGYVPTETTVGVRPKSEVSFPTKRNLYAEGSLYYKGSFRSNASTVKKIFLKSGNLEIGMVNKQAYINVGGVIAQTVAATTVKDFIIRASWSQSNLSIGLETTDLQTAEYNGAVVVSIGNSMMLTDSTYFYDGAIDDLVIWKKTTPTNELKLLSPSYNPMGRSFTSDFNDVISSKEKTFVEATLAPVDGSPILVEDEEGALEKVTFFDMETADYRTWNEEFIRYDGKSDYLLISYGNIDNENFKAAIYYEDVFVGFADKIEDRKVYLTLTDEQKKEYFGEELKVRYQLNRSYVVDYKHAALDSYRVQLAKAQGKELTVIQEGNRMNQMRLSTEVELNPLENAHSEGFLYISDKAQEIGGFRVFLTPDKLQADGIETSMLVIEPIDLEGNEVIGASLDVTASSGAIEPMISRKYAKIRSAGGRYYYTYHAPYMQTKVERQVENVSINIKDRRTGIGTEVPVYLRPVTSLAKAPAKAFSFESQIVFEYLAKCFKRQDAPDAWVALLDQNQDGRVDEFEIKWLQDNINNPAIKRIAQQLKGMEG